MLRQILACVFGTHHLGRPKVDLYSRCLFSLCHCCLPYAPNYHTVLKFLISSTSILSLFTFSGNLITISSELNVVRFFNYQVISFNKFCSEMLSGLEWCFRVFSPHCSKRYYVQASWHPVYYQAKDHYFIIESDCLS